MANAPPTPPATTPIELADEARSNAAVATSSPAAAETTQPPAPSQSASETRPEIYQSMMPAVIESIQRNDYERVVGIAENTEFMTASDRHPSRLLAVAPLVLGFLILDDTSPARHALLRLPDNVAHLPLSRALMSLVIATTNREHAKVYDQIKSLSSLVNQPDFMDKDLAAVITEMLSAFTISFRSRTFALLTKAYTSLPLSLACMYLGWPQEEVVAVAGKNGWSYDQSSQEFHPVANSKSSSPRVLKTSSISSLNTFHFVADSVAKLEI